MAVSGALRWLGALVLFWILIMFYVAVNVPHNEKDKLMEEELDVLSQNIRKLH
jgi:hypothetical protein